MGMALVGVPTGGGEMPDVAEMLRPIGIARLTDAAMTDAPVIDRPIGIARATRASACTLVAMLRPIGMARLRVAALPATGVDKGA